MNTATNTATEARLRKAKLLITTLYFGTKDGKEVSNTTIQNDVDYTNGRIEFSAIGEDTIVAQVLNTNSATLALRGLAYSIKAGATAETIPQFFREAKDRISNINSGVFNERAGERGANLDRFVTVLCAIPDFTNKIGSNDPGNVRAWVEGKLNTLNTKEESEGTRKKDQDCAGDVWLSTIRRLPLYQEKQLEMFPRQPRAKKEVKVDDLFA